MLKRLSLSRRWVGAQFGWVLAWIWINIAALYLPDWLSKPWGVSYSILITIVALFVQAGMLRSLMSDEVKRVRLFWGALALLVWVILYLIAAEMQDYLTDRIMQWLLAWIVTPIIFFPFAAASAVWGWRLPWRRVVRVVSAWRWWLGVLLAGTFGKLAELYFDRLRGWPKVWDVDSAAGLKMGAIDMSEMVVWILLLGWLVVLLDASARGVKSTVEDFVSLTLSESGNDAGGNI